MKASIIALVVLCGLVRGAVADPAAEPSYACKVLAADTKISATFAPEVSLHDLAAWVIGFTCKTIIFSADVAKHATRVTIISPVQMTPKRALQLFVDAIEATGLVVVQKADSIIIKLGPHMPASCPDPVSSDRPATIDPPPAPPVNEPEAGFDDADLDAAIHKIDDTHVTITRAMVDKILANPMAASKGARIVAAVKNGKPDGFKLYAIRPSSVYARLGFQNGDTLLSVNGQELVSADKALDIYTSLRDTKTLELALTRRGKPVTIILTIK